MKSYVISVVMIRSLRERFNIQNKLYSMTGINQEEASGKVLALLPADFPDHQLNTICYMEVPTAPTGPSLKDAILDVQSRHFRTDKDTGANSNAMLVMNSFRALADMDRLTVGDLPTWCPVCMSYEAPHDHE